MQNSVANFVSEPSAAASTRMSPAAAPINLWVVDDNQRMRDTMMELFGQCAGIQCTAAFHSPNAVLSALASRVGPDVILLDVNLGDHNGLDAIRPIKSLSRSTQVLMFTTFFDSGYRERAITSGASDFLLKSFPLEKIITAIRQARSKPAPHLKRKPTAAAMAPDGDSAAVPLASESPTTAKPSPALDAPPPTRKHLAWIKNCLDMIRAARN